MVIPHHDFILKPITDVLEDGFVSMSHLGNGIETYPIHDYVLQSIFLKMTGFQEQKSKCIVWAIATHDFDYRYTMMNKDKIGESSSYEDKLKVFQALIIQLQKKRDDAAIEKLVDKNKLRLDTLDKVDYILNKYGIRFLDRHIQEFHNDPNLLNIDYFYTSSSKATSIKKKFQLFKEEQNDSYCLTTNHELMRRHRNRCAHNLLSYQKNLPDLGKLAESSYKFNNYYVYFLILILIDEIFMQLFEEYKQMILKE